MKRERHHKKCRSQHDRISGQKEGTKKNHHTITGLASKNTLMPNPVGNFKNVLRVLSFNIAQILDIVMGWVSIWQKLQGKEVYRRSLP